MSDEEDREEAAGGVRSAEPDPKRDFAAVADEDKGDRGGSS